MAWLRNICWIAWFKVSLRNSISIPCQNYWTLVQKNVKKIWTWNRFSSPWWIVYQPISVTLATLLKILKVDSVYMNFSHPISRNWSRDHRLVRSEAHWICMQLSCSSLWNAIQTSMNMSIKFWEMHQTTVQVMSQILMMIVRLILQNSWQLPLKLWPISSWQWTNTLVWSSIWGSRRREMWLNILLRL